MTENDERLRERILEYVKSYHARNGIAPSMGRIAKHFHTYYKKVKKLFPGGAVDVYNQAGVPIPKERIKQTERAMRGRMMKLARQAKAKAKPETAEHVRAISEETKKPTTNSFTLLRLSSLVDSMVDALLDVLLVLHVSEAHLKNFMVGDIADEAARRLLDRIGRVDPDNVREVLERQDQDGYLSFLDSYGVLDFSRRNEEIEESHVKRRRAWVDLLKKYHPELLTDYLT